MRPKLVIVYLLIVIAPLAAVGWLGAALARNEQTMVAVRFREVLTGKLNDTASNVAGLIEQRERELMTVSNLSALSPADLRERARASGIVRQYFVLDQEGDLVYPSPSGELMASEVEFLRRTESIWSNGEIPGPNAESQQASRAVQSETRTKGWHVGFWGSGVSLVFWWRDERGAVVGAELNEARLISDIVGILPETTTPEYTGRMSRSRQDDCTTLVDPKDAVVYKWGAYSPNAKETPRADVALFPPLQAWSLKYYSPAAPYGQGMIFSVILGFTAFGVALVVLALYFYRENTRAIRDALQRVSFVNQVSHELKTPLTNIRMYAEMLDGDLGEADTDTRRRLGVIVSESQRLSRLINNVLTFGRNQRKLLTLHRTPGIIDEALRSIISTFDAPLNARGVTVDLVTGAGQEANFDRDALEQIMGNLLSNAEKYAPNSGRLEITSHQNGDTVTITVSDQGPGIAGNLRERIFEPFYRVSNKLTDGVAGAGIGLTIARHLARLHGGNLTLEPSPRGARFKVTLRATMRRSGGTP
ncbi:MAG: HAMP domain-containing histidine kinase [Candidatus Hydrogenedentes bacterium]|nr:HAMP domain-containing histidine kinase [Candidatus Hydrogenedentota bacterium]